MFYFLLFCIMSSPIHSDSEKPPTAAEIIASLSDPVSGPPAVATTVVTVRQLLERITPNHGVRIAIAGLAMDSRSRDAWIAHAEEVRGQERIVFFAALHRMAQGRALSLVEEA